MSSIPRGAGIYRIDGPTGGVYIGSAQDLPQRWRQHRSELNRGIHKSLHMQNAWNKYGGDLFTFAVIECVDNPDHLLDREQVWLDILFAATDRKNIYNISRLAESRRGLKASEETRIRIKEASRKVWEQKSDEEKARVAEISRAWWDGLSDVERAAHGRKTSAAWAQKPDEEKARISDRARARWEQKTGEDRAYISAKLCAASTIRGKPRTDAVKKRLSDAHTGRTRTPQELANLSRGHRKGEIYTMVAPDGTVYKDIDSLTSFAKEHGMSRETVHNILIGKYKNKAGWHGFITHEET